MGTDSDRPQPDGKATVEEFVALAEALADKAEALPHTAFNKIERLDRRGRRNRFYLVLIGILAVAVAVVGVIAIRNTVRLDHTLNVQRVRACAFYTIFLQADTPQARAASPDKAAYDHAFEVIRDNYAALDCTKTS